MFQSVSSPSHKQFYELETLAAQVISPLMTARGVYYEGKVPPPVSTPHQQMKKSKSSGNSLKLDYIFQPFAVYYVIVEYTE